MTDSIKWQPEAPVSQRDLMGRMARGSELALGTIYDHLSEPTYAICWHYLDNQRAVDKAMLGLWLYVWENAQTLCTMQGSPWSVIVATAEHYVRHHGTTDQSRPAGGLSASRTPISGQSSDIESSSVRTNATSR